MRVKKATKLKKQYITYMLTYISLKDILHLMIYLLMIYIKEVAFWQELIR